jgi:hypothetical protein
MTTSRERVYPGSKTGQQLANYFNSSRASKRAMDLFLDLIDLLKGPTLLREGDMLREIIVEEKSPKSPLGYHVRNERITKERAERQSKYGPRQWRAFCMKLERTLRTYSFVPELDERIHMWPTPKRMSFHWRSRNGREGIAILWILELLGIGRLDRVRRCQRCYKWFFSAVKKEGKFCSIECQRGFYRSKNETREQHREYMRGWRDAREREKAARR